MSVVLLFALGGALGNKLFLQGKNVPFCPPKKKSYALFVSLHSPFIFLLGVER